jgi:hypothetical protein
MNNKTIYIFFMIGAILIIAGALMKIMHYEYAQFVLGTGLGLEVGAIAFFLGKLLRAKKENL